jgi:alpha-tubulin suppressor-like RCC1 family protein
MATPAQRTNTWILDEWYDQSVAGTTGGYVGAVELWTWGRNDQGYLGDNSIVNRSSPIQVPGSWTSGKAAGNYPSAAAIKSDGTLWTWGDNDYGILAINVAPSTFDKSSPVQVGTDTTWNNVTVGNAFMFSKKTDGTLWCWGSNQNGALGLNQPNSPGSSTIALSSPTQVGTDTTWNKFDAGFRRTHAIKTDGTLWSWGYANFGYLGQNVSGPAAQRSSPVQVPGEWSEVADGQYHVIGLKTNGTLWAWGYRSTGALGINNNIDRSSPTQIGTGADWSAIASASYSSAAIKTDGTLWTWGRNNYGALGQNSPNPSHLSSPMQVPGTTWSSIALGEDGGTQNSYALKTDNTLWAWGYADLGGLGQNNQEHRSSPVQIPGTTWSSIRAEARGGIMAIKSM